MTRTVAVVGAGALGTTAAYDLARRGADVTLYDRDAVGSGATGRAAGIVYDAFAEDRDAHVATRALRRFRALDGTHGFSLTDCPYVWLAREDDDHRADAIREQVERMQVNGRDVELVAPTDLGDRYPSLRTDDVAVAAIAHDAGYADPSAYAGSMAVKAERAGATVRTGTAVTLDRDSPGVVDDDGTTTVDAVLVAAGAHSARLLADAGIAIAMKPYRVQALETRNAGEVPTVYDATAGFYARPQDTGLLAGDGTEEREADPTDWRREADPEFVSSMRHRLAHRFPDTHSVDRSWAGLCTATPDRNPLLGSVDDGVYVATGFHGHGFMRAPALGEVVAEQVLGGPGIDAFAPTRFDGDEAFPVVEGMTIDDGAGK